MQVLHPLKYKGIRIKRFIKACPSVVKIITPSLQSENNRQPPALIQTTNLHQHQEEFPRSTKTLETCRSIFHNHFPFLFLLYFSIYPYVRIIIIKNESREQKQISDLRLPKYPKDSTFPANHLSVLFQSVSPFQSIYSHSISKRIITKQEEDKQKHLDTKNQHSQIQSRYSLQPDLYISLYRRFILFAHQECRKSDSRQKKP